MCFQKEEVKLWQKAVMFHFKVKILIKHRKGDKRGQRQSKHVSWKMVVSLFIALVYIFSIKNKQRII